MEEQAALSDRFNRAADQYVAGNNPRLRAAEREQVLRDREGDIYAAARERRINSNRQIAASDPGRFSSFERNALLGLQHTSGGDIPLMDRQERAGLRAHELAIADKGIEQERVKAWGMANQGGVAAGIRAGVDRELGRAQHGYFDENGNYVPGSTVQAAEATGLWKSELQDNNWRNRFEQLQIQEYGRNNRQQKQIEAGQEKTKEWGKQKGLDREANSQHAAERTSRIKERQAQQDAMREQRDFEAFDKIVGTVNSNLTPEQEKEYQALKPEERKTWWKNHVGRGDQQQDGAPKNGDRKQFKQGWGTWKDGKWVLDDQ